MPIFYKQIKFISAHNVKQYNEYTVKNKHNDRKNSKDKDKDEDNVNNHNNNDQITNASTMTLRYRNTHINDGEMTDVDDSSEYIDTDIETDTTHLNAMSKREIEMQLRIHYREPNVRERFNYSSIELNRFKKYGIKYLHPLLIECIKHDCVNVIT